MGKRRNFVLLEGNYFLIVEILRKFRRIINRKGFSDVDIYILKLYKLHVYIAFIKLLVHIFEKQLERARYLIIYTRENR